MCLTVPLKIEKITENGRAILSDGRLIDISILPNAGKGDWILVNADLAVAKITEAEAREIKDYFKK